MRIHRPGLLKAFWVQHPDAESSLRAWFHEAKCSAWTTLADLQTRYRTATILKDGRVTIDICETKYRLIVRVDLAAKIIVICSICLHPGHRPSRRRTRDA